MEIEKIVKKWNAHYELWATREKLDDLETTEYEEGVAYTLIDEVCEYDISLAIAVFDHPLCKGGWLHGNAGDFMRKLKKKKEVANGK